MFYPSFIITQKTCQTPCHSYPTLVSRETLYRVVLRLHEQFYCRFSLSRFLWLAPKDKQQNNKNWRKIVKKLSSRTDWLKRGRWRVGVALLLTFISTDSLSFSRLIILMATFLPITQCTPNLTSPATGECKRVSISFSTYICMYSDYSLPVWPLPRVFSRR